MWRIRVPCAGAQDPRLRHSYRKQFVASSLLLPLSPRSLRRPEHLRHFHHRRVARRRHLGRVVERDGHGDEQRRCGRWWRGAERQCVHAVQTLAAANPATGTACASAVRRAASLALGLWTLQEFRPRGIGELKIPSNSRGSAYYKPTHRALGSRSPLESKACAAEVGAEGRTDTARSPAPPPPSSTPQAPSPAVRAPRRGPWSAA